MSDLYRVLLEPRARKNLAHIDPVIRRRIGDYRIVYSADDGEQEVVVLDIDHRRDIYR